MGLLWNRTSGSNLGNQFGESVSADNFWNRRGPVWTNPSGYPIDQDANNQALGSPTAPYLLPETLPLQEDLIVDQRVQPPAARRWRRTSVSDEVISVQTVVSDDYSTVRVAPKGRPWLIPVPREPDAVHIVIEEDYYSSVRISSKPKLWWMNFAQDVDVFHIIIDEDYYSAITIQVDSSWIRTPYADDASLVPPTPPPTPTPGNKVIVVSGAPSPDADEWIDLSWIEVEVLVPWTRVETLVPHITAAVLVPHVDVEMHLVTARADVLASDAAVEVSVPAIEVDLVVPEVQSDVVHSARARPRERS